VFVALQPMSICGFAATKCYLQTALPLNCGLPLGCKVPVVVIFANKAKAQNKHSMHVQDANSQVWDGKLQEMTKTWSETHSITYKE